MWRKLNEEEKRNLAANYLVGTYLLRFLLGIWMLFVTIGFFFGIKSALEAMSQGDYFAGVGSLIAGAIGGIVFYGIPIVLLRKIGTEEIQALREDEVYLGEALFVSGHYSHRSKQPGRVIRYYAKIQLLDAYGKVVQEVECRSIGNLRSTCRVGEKITVLKVAKTSGDELIAMKQKII